MGWGDLAGPPPNFGQKGMGWGDLGGGLSMNSTVYFDICLKRQDVQISD